MTNTDFSKNSADQLLKSILEYLDQPLDIVSIDEKMDFILELKKITIVKEEEMATHVRGAIHD